MLELNITKPTLIEAGLVIIRRVLNQIISHEIDAIVGINYIHEELHDEMSSNLEKKI